MKNATELFVMVIILSLVSLGCTKESMEEVVSTNDTALKQKNSTPRPFKGSVTYYHDTETDLTCDCEEGYFPGGPWVGTGNLTHLGNTDAWAIPCFQFGFDNAGLPFFETISQCGSIVAANGDILEFIVQPYTINYSVDCGCFTGTAETIVDGDNSTGRFAGATGNIPVHVVTYLPVFDPTVVPSTSSTYDGYITY